jgi:hypothetical protein
MPRALCVLSYHAFHVRFLSLLAEVVKRLLPAGTRRITPDFVERLYRLLDRPAPTPGSEPVLIKIRGQCWHLNDPLLIQQQQQQHQQQQATTAMSKSSELSLGSSSSGSSGNGNGNGEPRTPLPPTSPMAAGKTSTLSPQTPQSECALCAAAAAVAAAAPTASGSGSDSGSGSASSSTSGSGSGSGSTATAAARRRSSADTGPIADYKCEFSMPALTDLPMVWYAPITRHEPIACPARASPQLVQPRPAPRRNDVALRVAG